MLSPVWPGGWKGSDMLTPCARMHRAKLIMSRSDCAWVSAVPPADVCRPELRLATRGAEGEGEHAAMSITASTAASTAPVARRPGGQPRRAAEVAGTSIG